MNEPLKYLKIQKGENFPVELHVDVTNHCNKACDICPMKDRYKKDIFPLGYMDFDLYKKIIDEICVYHEKPEINLHKDGEPLLHPLIGEFIRYAKDKGCFTHFTTNGILLEKRKEEIIESGLDLITVSVTSNILIDSINKFTEYKGKNNLPILQIKTFGSLDIKGLPQADRYLVRELHNWTKPIGNRRKPCEKLLYNPAITWDGWIQMCCVDYLRERTFGNMKDTTLKEAWNKIREVYRQQERGIFAHPCTTCTY